MGKRKVESGFRCELLTWNDLIKIFGLTRATLGGLRNCDPAFPHPVYLGGKTLRFRRTDVEFYIKNLPTKKSASVHEEIASANGE